MFTSELTSLLASLVAIPSINPAERSQWSQPYGESNIGQFVYDWFIEHGLDAELNEVAPGRPNVMVQADGADNTKTLLLSAHLDTVDVAGMTISPFEPTIKDGRLFGRGSCDTKGSLAAMMIAFRDRVKKGSLPYNLTFLATCGEEHNMLGARSFAARHGASISGAIFGEPTRLSVVVAHKGVARLKISSLGRPAHSSTPQLGKNAIYPLARAITLLEDYAAKLPQGRSHHRLGHETLTVSIVQGGQQANIVPDSCNATIDWRLLPGHSAQQGRAELEQLLKDNGLGDISVEMFNEYAAVETDENSPMVTKLTKIAAEFTANQNAAVAAYGTDASAFNSFAIPTVVFGPGDAGKAHCQDEYIELADLEAGLKAYANFLAIDWFK